MEQNHLKRRDDPQISEGEKSENKEKVPEKTPASMKKQEKSVLIYTSILFVVALVLILIAYATQQRTTNTLTNITAQHGQFSNQALQNIEDLQNKNQELTDSLQAAQDEIRDLTDKLEEAQMSLQEQAGELARLAEASDAADKETAQAKLDLEDQRRRTEALGLLTALLSAKKGDDVTEVINQLETLRDYLDGAYLNIYNSYLENR